jgi:hypothetical protein
MFSRVSESIISSRILKQRLLGSNSAAFASQKCARSTGSVTSCVACWCAENSMVKRRGRRDSNQRFDRRVATVSLSQRLSLFVMMSTYLPPGNEHISSPGQPSNNDSLWTLFNFDLACAGVVLRAWTFRLNIEHPGKPDPT